MLCLLLLTSLSDLNLGPQACQTLPRTLSDSFHPLLPPLSTQSPHSWSPLSFYLLVASVIHHSEKRGLWAICTRSCYAL